MHDDELKKMWQSASPQDVIQFINSTKNLKEMNAKIQKLDRAIERRNLREIVICAILLIGLGAGFFIETSLIAHVCFAVLILVTVFIAYKWLAVRTSRKLPDASMSIREQFVNDYNYFTAERKLIKNIAYWYILPIIIPIIVYALSWQLPIWMKALYIVIVVLTGWLTYRFTMKWAKQFDAPIQELEEAIQQLEE